MMSDAPGIAPLLNFIRGENIMTAHVDWLEEMITQEHVAKCLQWKETKFVIEETAVKHSKKKEKLQG